MSSKEPVPVVVIALVIANVLVYLLTINSAFNLRPTVLVDYGFAPKYLVGDLSRAFVTIFTSMFLHANIAHIALNMLALVVVGRAVETSLGHRYVLLVYVVSGIGAALLYGMVQLALNDPYNLLVGASGAISGILGSSVILGSRAAFAWFAMQLILGIASLGVGGLGGIAFMAHIGGFLTGIAITKLVIYLERANKHLV